VPPADMVPLDVKGNGIPTRSALPTHPEHRPPPAPAPGPERKLDVVRTWFMIRSLITDPKVSVQWIFVGRPLSQLLLQHARRRNEPGYIIERAEAVMHQPSDAQNHMDHWHLRLFCAPSDRYQGCIDRGPARWLKKDLKYVDSPQPVAQLAPVDLRALAFPHLRLGH